MRKRKRYVGRVGGAPHVFHGPQPRSIRASLLRVIGAPTPAAQLRVEILVWHPEHGSVVRRTARHFGCSPDTISRWARRFASGGARNLVDRSRRPHKVRTPTTATAIAKRIGQLRERYPRWGREKLRVLLLREGITVSAKTIDRTLERLRRQGDLKEPHVVKMALRRRRLRMATLRRPVGLIVDRPGYLQLDSQDLREVGGKAHVFAAIDHFTRKRVVSAAARATADAGAQFFALARATFPFAIWAIQTDGGSEFMGGFVDAARAAGVAHYINRPNYPQGQGRVERSFLTDVLECYEVDGYPPDLRALSRQIAAWNAVYENIRPHQALGYRTPNEFYGIWMRDQPSPPGRLSDMS